MEYLIARLGERLVVTPATAIDWIEAKGDYVQIHCGKETSLVRKSMKELESELDGNLFVRVHRSTIVNVDRIRELHRMFHGDFGIVLRDGTKVTLSRRYRSRFEQIVGGTL